MDTREFYERTVGLLLQYFWNHLPPEAAQGVLQPAQAEVEQHQGTPLGEALRLVVQSGARHGFCPPVPPRIASAVELGLIPGLPAGDDQALLELRRFYMEILTHRPQELVGIPDDLVVAIENATGYTPLQSLQRDAGGSAARGSGGAVDDSGKGQPSR